MKTLSILITLLFVIIILGCSSESSTVPVQQNNQDTAQDPTESVRQTPEQIREAKKIEDKSDTQFENDIARRAMEILMVWRDGTAEDYLNTIEPNHYSGVKKTREELIASFEDNLIEIKKQFYDQENKPKKVTVTEIRRAPIDPTTGNRIDPRVMVVYNIDNKQSGIRLVEVDGIYYVDP
ncbi:hypothetical protein CMO93_02405 [Candidatus Woesearchaeota archaeon]|nr:hypothetical protein [Candidatus Woesearchaeota archaeon]|tara:strand:- start:1502 stop:2041 length:540 start_codon:yes stop_codon:yes gene_type:complete